MVGVADLFESKQCCGYKWYKCVLTVQEAPQKYTGYSQTWNPTKCKWDSHNGSKHICARLSVSYCRSGRLIWEQRYGYKYVLTVHRGPTKYTWDSQTWKWSSTKCRWDWHNGSKHICACYMYPNRFLYWVVRLVTQFCHESRFSVHDRVLSLLEGWTEWITESLCVCVCSCWVRSSCVIDCFWKFRELVEAPYID